MFDKSGACVNTSLLVSSRVSLFLLPMHTYALVWKGRACYLSHCTINHIETGLGGVI